jgi:hypothetical protein
MEEKLLELVIDLLKRDKKKSTDETPFLIGKSYFVRTVTYHLVGRLKNIKGKFLVFKEGAWVADSGRFADAINKGELSEVEPLSDDFFVNVDTITDAFIWIHKLPRKQK